MITLRVTTMMRVLATTNPNALWSEMSTPFWSTVLMKAPYGIMKSNKELTIPSAALQPKTFLLKKRSFWPGA